MNENSLVKKAEQNCVNRAKDMSEMLNIVDALAHAGNKIFSTDNTINDFSEGIRLIRKAFYEKYTRAICDCFMFTGVGGKEAEDYAYERFEERFGEDKYTIMNLLESNGNIPNRWKIDTEEKFKKEAKKLINKK